MGKINFRSTTLMYSLNKLSISFKLVATEWSQHSIQRNSLLANALANAIETNDQVELKQSDSNKHGLNNVESEHNVPDQNRLNEMYKKWDPKAYQQWSRLQLHQCDKLERMLAYTFTRSRPINYGESYY